MKLSFKPTTEIYSSNGDRLTLTRRWHVVDGRWCEYIASEWPPTNTHQVKTSCHDCSSSQSEPSPPYSTHSLRTSNQYSPQSGS